MCQQKVSWRRVNGDDVLDFGDKTLFIVVKFLRPDLHINIRNDYVHLLNQFSSNSRYGKCSFITLYHRSWANPNGKQRWIKLRRVFHIVFFDRLISFSFLFKQKLLQITISESVPGASPAHIEKGREERDRDSPKSLHD